MASELRNPASGFCITHVLKLLSYFYLYKRLIWFYRECMDNVANVGCYGQLHES